MSGRAFTVVVALLSLGLIGCERREMGNAEERASYRRDMESRLYQLEAEIDTLVARGREAGEDARQEWNQQISGLQAQRDSARTRLDRLEDAGQEAWEDVKEGTDRMLGRLEDSIGDAREGLQSRADSVTTRTS